MLWPCCESSFSLAAVKYQVSLVIEWSHIILSQFYLVCVTNWMGKKWSSNTFSTKFPNVLSNFICLILQLSTWLKTVVYISKIIRVETSRVWSRVIKMLHCVVWHFNQLNIYYCKILKQWRCFGAIYKCKLSRSSDKMSTTIVVAVLMVRNDPVYSLGEMKANAYTSIFWKDRTHFTDLWLLLV